jgi:hypothetical protein
MTSRPDERVPPRVSWPWIATLVGIALFFLLLIAVALHVQRTAERELAGQQQELGTLVQRSLELELETERLLQSGAPRVRLSLLRGRSTTPEAHGALWWDADRQQGQLQLAGLPAGPDEFELWVDESPVPGTQFTAPAAGPVQVRLSAEAGEALSQPGRLSIRRWPAAAREDGAKAQGPETVLQEP